MGFRYVYLQHKNQNGGGSEHTENINYGGVFFFFSISLRLHYSFTGNTVNRQRHIFRNRL